MINPRWLCTSTCWVHNLLGRASPDGRASAGAALARAAGLVRFDTVDERYDTSVDRYLVDSETIQADINRLRLLQADHIAAAFVGEATDVVHAGPQAVDVPGGDAHGRLLQVARVDEVAGDGGGDGHGGRHQVHRAGGPHAAVEALPGLQAASMEGRSAVTGARATRVQQLGGRSFELPARCAAFEVYNLHGNVCIGARDRSGLERLCRYVLRHRLLRSAPPAPRC